MKGWRPDWFLTGMAAAVGLAWLWPEPGASGGVLQPELLNRAGIAVIFFLHGAALPTAALRSGTLRWPAHLMIQGCTFGLFPLLGWVLWQFSSGWLSDDLRFGFFYLCALPSTVSSSVALTAAAGGNVPVALFNATLSSLLGIFLTPLWLGWVVATTADALPFQDVVLDLVRWLLVPFAVGQLSRPVIGRFIAQHKAKINVVDRVIILVLVYTSFCDAVVGGVWQREGWGVVSLTVVLCLGLFGLALVSTRAISRGIGLPRDEQIAAIFCGSKKTLASGVPMAQIIFAGHPAVAVILLPIMIYHPLQLILCAGLAARWAKRRD